jgi:hypothetical protein
VERINTPASYVQQQFQCLHAFWLSLEPLQLSFLRAFLSLWPNLASRTCKAGDPNEEDASSEQNGKEQKELSLNKRMMMMMMMLR